MRALIPIFLLCTLTACGGLSITEDDQRAMDAVAQLFAGSYEFTKGYASQYGIGPDAGTVSYFTVILSNSKAMENNHDFRGVYASRMAYEVYAQLGEGRHDYSQIFVEINLANGETPKWSYSIEELAEVMELQSVIDTVTELIKHQDYEGLSEQFLSEPDPAPSIEQIRAVCAPADSSYGKVEQTEFLGFVFHQAEGDYRSYAYLLGTMEREEEDTALTLIVNRFDQKLAGLNFSY